MFGATVHIYELLFADRRAPQVMSCIESGNACDLLWSVTHGIGVLRVSVLRGGVGFKYLCNPLATRETVVNCNTVAT